MFGVACRRRHGVNANTTERESRINFTPRRADCCKYNYTQSILAQSTSHLMITIRMVLTVVIPNNLHTSRTTHLTLCSLRCADTPIYMLRKCRYQLKTLLQLYDYFFNLQYYKGVEISVNSLIQNFIKYVQNYQNKVANHVYWSLSGNFCPQ
jgi:hypothetical protein